MSVDWGQRLFPVSAAADAEPIHGRPCLPETTPPDRPYVAINMVASVDGRAALSGSAVGLGSATDARLMRVLRAEADVLLNGAATVRAETMAPSVPDDLARERVARGQPAQPAGVVLSNSGAVPIDRPYFRRASPEWPRVIYVPAEAAVDPSLEAPGIEVRRLPGPALDPAAVLHDLHARGVRRIVCEGGPTLNGALLADDLVDELFFTLAPLVVGGRHPLTMLVGDDLGPRRATLRSLYARDGELFFRYAVR